MTAYARRCAREDEYDRLAARLHEEGLESGRRVRAAFHTVGAGLMGWSDPPTTTYRLYDPQGEVEPFDVQADWDELA